MGLFDALGEIIAAPIRIAAHVADDLSSLSDSSRDETDGMLALGTMGLSSVAKGLVDTIENTVDKLEK